MRRGLKCPLFYIQESDAIFHIFANAYVNLHLVFIP